MADLVGDLARGVDEFLMRGLEGLLHRSGFCADRDGEFACDGFQIAARLGEGRMCRLDLIAEQAGDFFAAAHQIAA